MTLADVNVLVYAFRPDAPLHRISKTWLENVMGSGMKFGVAPLALSALVRITTNKRAFPHPTPVAEAFAFCDRLLGQPNAVLVEPGAGHWRIFERLCREGGITGPTVTDAWYAALALEHGCRFITFDRDFARFPGLECREPG